MKRLFYVARFTFQVVEVYKRTPIQTIQNGNNILNELMKSLKI